MFGWFGEVGGTRENHTRRCLWSLNYLAERKARKTTKIIFRVFNTSNSSPIFLFCPRNPKSHFFWKYKKTRTGKLIEIRQVKSWFGAIWCHLGSIRMPVFEPKNSFALWLCSYVAMWLWGYVAMWLCGSVAMWLCGYVAMWLWGYVAMWLLLFFNMLPSKNIAKNVQ